MYIKFQLNPFQFQITSSLTSMAMTFASSQWLPQRGMLQYSNGKVTFTHLLVCVCSIFSHSLARPVCLSVCSKVIVVLRSTKPISYHGNWATLNILICSPDTVRSDECLLSSFSQPGIPICVLMRQPTGDRLGIHRHKGCCGSAQMAYREQDRVMIFTHVQCE